MEDSGIAFLANLNLRSPGEVAPEKVAVPSI